MNGLKTINDRYGHLAGSRALCRLADTLRQSCRRIDTPARFGGDEFAVVLPETGEAGGHVVLGAIHERLAADADTPALSRQRRRRRVSARRRFADPAAARRRQAAVPGQGRTRPPAPRAPRQPEERKTGTLF